MKTNIVNKTKLVNSVFSKVHKKYDIMNDIMSLGVHRIWKNKLIDWIKPFKGQKVIDVASGTGDIAKLYLKNTKQLSEITCVEPNTDMFSIGKSNFNKFKNVKWIKASAEKLPIQDNYFDVYTISYGIRNVSNINLALSEAFRVLKPGGRFMCLEFSKVNNELLDLFYQQYSKVIPLIGKFIVGNSKPYNYLINSIKDFYTQDELLKLIETNGFSNVEFRNLSSGISAIHSGWKV